MKLELGAAGAPVGQLQQALVEAGYAVGLGELAQANFGPGTAAAVRAFQAAHVGPNGHALEIDGEVGPTTRYALEHPGGGGGRYTVDGWRAAPTEAKLPLVPVMSWAIGQIGVHEDPDGSNRGPAIDIWTGFRETPAGQQGPPWCAYFISAAFGKLEIEGGSPVGIIASAYKWREWGKSAGRLISGFPGDGVSLLVGDVWGILRGDLHGHVGLVASVLPDGRVCTVEGNSGNAVRGLIRDPLSFTFVLRVIT